jgi:hypothetical protein
LHLGIFEQTEKNDFMLTAKFQIKNTLPIGSQNPNKFQIPIPNCPSLRPLSRKYLLSPGACLREAALAKAGERIEARGASACAAREGEMSSNVHPHPHPPPSRGRDIAFKFTVCACLPVGRGNEPVM